MTDSDMSPLLASLHVMYPFISFDPSYTGVKSVGCLMVMVLPEANLVIRDFHLRRSIRSRNLEDGIV